MLKFISPNDAGLTGSNQAGYLLPKQAWELYTPVAPERGKNDDSWPRVTWQDGRVTDSRVIWYGKKKHEYRLTRFGDDFPFRTADNVGDLLVIVPHNYEQFEAFVLDNDHDFEEIQASLGVEFLDNTWAAYEGGHAEPVLTPDQCLGQHFRQFAEAVTAFPPMDTFSCRTREALLDCIRNFSSLPADQRLILSTDHEYMLFKIVERKLCMPDIVRPFQSVDDFLATAQSILQRRKPRAGRSLENHVGYLLRDACIPFATRARIEGTKEPDILIPSKEAYEDRTYPVDRLYCVGVKTTCRDRWRQVLDEADRIPRKHILTLQKGISPTQFAQMEQKHVTLVVPQNLHSEYPPEVRPKLLTVDQFLDELHRVHGSTGSPTPGMLFH